MGLLLGTAVLQLPTEPVPRKQAPAVTVTAAVLVQKQGRPRKPLPPTQRLLRRLRHLPLGPRTTQARCLGCNPGPEPRRHSTATRVLAQRHLHCQHQRRRTVPRLRAEWRRTAHLQCHQPQLQRRHQRQRRTPATVDCRPQAAMLRRRATPRAPTARRRRQEAMVCLRTVPGRLVRTSKAQAVAGRRRPGQLTGRRLQLTGPLPPTAHQRTRTALPDTETLEELCMLAVASWLWCFASDSGDVSPAPLLSVSHRC